MSAGDSGHQRKTLSEILRERESASWVEGGGKRGSELDGAQLCLCWASRELCVAQAGQPAPLEMSQATRRG